MIIKEIGSRLSKERLGLTMIMVSLIGIAVLVLFIIQYQNTRRLVEVRTEGVNLVRLPGQISPGENRIHHLEEQEVRLVSDKKLVNYRRSRVEQVLEQLKQELPEREFHIPVMTSRTNLKYRQWSQTHDKPEFFKKPVSARQLLDALNKLFESVQPS